MNFFFFFIDRKWINGNEEEKGRFMLNSSILVIYTGGTIGMVKDPATQALIPFNLSQISRYIPELRRFKNNIKSISFNPAIDSSNVHPGIWARIAKIVNEYYDQFDGFVVLHGTDTMAYSASALSFMLRGLKKPVIFTGSQLPIGTLRTDGKENFLAAIEIASAKKNGMAIVPEVCIFFEFKLLRGNRTHKQNADHFQAFRSNNFPLLAEAGIEIKFFEQYIRYPKMETELHVFTKMDVNVAILKIFPGITPRFLDAILSTPNLKGLILETYGSGNAPSSLWFTEKLDKAIKKGLIILNVTQCEIGGVNMDRYFTGNHLRNIGVVGGRDITVEAALTKMMFLFGQDLSRDEIIHFLNVSICGEMSVDV